MASGHSWLSVWKPDGYEIPGFQQAPMPSRSSGREYGLDSRPVPVSMACVRLGLCWPLGEMADAKHSKCFSLRESRFESERGYQESQPRLPMRGMRFCGKGAANFVGHLCKSKQINTERHLLSLSRLPFRHAGDGLQSSPGNGPGQDQGGRPAGLTHPAPGRDQVSGRGRAVSGTCTRSTRGPRQAVKAQGRVPAVSATS